MTEKDYLGKDQRKQKDDKAKDEAPIKGNQLFYSRTNLKCLFNLYLSKIN